VVLLFLLGMVLSACGSAPVAENWPGLTVYGDTVYAISGMPQQVYMLDAETLDPKATFPPPVEGKGIAYWSPVTVGGDLAFVGFAIAGDNNAALYAFDPETGQQQWRVSVESLIMPQPAYVDGVVYVGDSNGWVYAVDVESERVKPGWPFDTGAPIWASLLVEGGRVYVASMDHHLYSLDAESGDLIWKQKLGGAMAAPPRLGDGFTLEDGILYIGAFDGRVHAVKADTGEIVEGFEFLAENWIWSLPLMTIHGGRDRALSLQQRRDRQQEGHDPGRTCRGRRVHHRGDRIGPGDRGKSGNRAAGLLLAQRHAPV
jgi:outer membrane protein assembly factor BamB